jgi:hypothetical protein
MPITTEPIEVGTFDKMWISNVTLINNGNGILRLVLNPYDGQNMLVTNATIKSYTNLKKMREDDEDFDKVITSLIAECKRQANTTRDVASLIVNAPSPDNKVFAIICFKKAKGEEQVANHIIQDFFGLVAADQTFAGVFQAAMAMFAQKAGFAYQQA